MNTDSTTYPETIFCTHGPKNWQQCQTGMLVNKRLAVKDLFAVKGEKNSAGNPDWLAKSELAKQSSFAVKQLMENGCLFLGFTQTDEMAYSLEGNNLHYGAAENPKLAGHACGGSSMGSAAAVAAGLADIGLGTDTGGSIRVPASYCGIYGIRPSHAVIDSNGLIPLAPAFDTTGWFTNEAELLANVGEVLLPQQEVADVNELVVCDELFELVEPELAKVLLTKLEEIKPMFKQVRKFEIPDKTLLNQLADTFRVLQGREVQRTHGKWLSNDNPNLSEPIAQRFEMAMAITAEEELQAKKVQQQWQNVIQNNLSANSALFMPTTPTIAPKLKEDTSELRMRILTLTAIAGLTGAVQVHLPYISVEYANNNAPYGFSLLMTANNDKSLLALATQLERYK